MNIEIKKISDLVGQEFVLSGLFHKGYNIEDSEYFILENDFNSFFRKVEYIDFGIENLSIKNITSFSIEMGFNINNEACLLLNVDLNNGVTINDYFYVVLKDYKFKDNNKLNVSLGKFIPKFEKDFFASFNLNKCFSIFELREKQDFLIISFNQEFSSPDNLMLLSKVIYEDILNKQIKEDLTELLSEEISNSKQNKRKI